MSDNKKAKLYLVIENDRIIDGALDFESAKRKAIGYIDKGRDSVSVFVGVIEGEPLWPKEVTS